MHSKSRLRLYCRICGPEVGELRYASACLGACLAVPSGLAGGTGDAEWSILAGSSMEVENGGKRDAEGGVNRDARSI